MFLNQLIESPERDVDRSMLADLLYGKINEYLYRCMKSGKDLDKIVYGEEMPGITISDLDVPRYFADVIIVFENNDWAMGGKAVKFKQPVMGQYNYLVIIGVDGSTTADIWKSFNYDRVGQVFRHEIQHIIDFKRFKGDVFNSKPQAKNPKDDLPAYHNSPEEMNAYYHNLAEPLLRRLRLIGSHGTEMDGLLSPISRNFNEYVGNNLSTSHGVLKRHWENLSQDNRNKVFRRLYQLFKHYWEVMDAGDKYSNSSTEVTNV